MERGVCSVGGGPASRDHFFRLGEPDSPTLDPTVVSCLKAVCRKARATGAGDRGGNAEYKVQLGTCVFTAPQDKSLCWVGGTLPKVFLVIIL